MGVRRCAWRRPRRDRASGPIPAGRRSESGFPGRHSCGGIGSPHATYREKAPGLARRRSASASATSGPRSAPTAAYTPAALAIGSHRSAGLTTRTTSRLVSRSRAKANSLPAPNNSEASMPLTLRISSRFFHQPLGAGGVGHGRKSLRGIADRCDIHKGDLRGIVCSPTISSAARMRNCAPGLKLRHPPADRLLETVPLESHFVATGNRRAVQQCGWRASAGVSGQEGSAFRLPPPGPHRQIPTAGHSSVARELRPQSGLQPVGLPAYLSSGEPGKRRATFLRGVSERTAVAHLYALAGVAAL